MTPPTDLGRGHNAGNQTCGIIEIGPGPANDDPAERTQPVLAYLLSDHDLFRRTRTTKSGLAFHLSIELADHS